MERFIAKYAVSIPIPQKAITIKVENIAITSSLKTILNNFDIVDLYINEPPIDEIIGKILIKEDYEI